MTTLVFLTLLANVILANFHAPVKQFTLITMDFSLPGLFYFQASVSQSCCSLFLMCPPPHFFPSLFKPKNSSSSFKTKIKFYLL